MLVYICVSVFLLSGMCYSADYITLVGDEGRSGRIDCHYPQGNEEKVKYFCRLQGFSCDDLIRTSTRNAWVKQGRFNLFDNTKAHIFTLIISNLSLDDTGKYWCGVDISMLPDFNAEVRILVKPMENSTSPVPVQITEEASSPAGKEKQSHFRFLTVITLVCVGMLLFVCLFSLVHLVKRINTCSLSVSASYNVRRKPNSGHTEDDYVRMKPGVTRVTSPVDDPPSCLQPHNAGAALDSMCVPEIDPYYLEPIAVVSSGLDPDYIDLNASRLSSVYQKLNNELLEESVYHTIDVASS